MALIRESYKNPHPFLWHVVECLILTGARRGEIRLAQWSHIDMEESLLVVAVKKTGKRRVIHLSERSKSVIVAIRDKSEALGQPATLNSFPANNPKTGKPYNDFQVSFSRARATLGINDGRIHDLRHTSFHPERSEPIRGTEAFGSFHPQYDAALCAS